MTSKISYYGSAILIGLIYFVFLQKTVQQRQELATIINPYQDAYTEFEEEDEKVFTSRREAYSDKFKPSEVEKLKNNNKEHFVCTNCALNHQTLRFIFLASSEFVILLEEADSTLVYAYGEVIKHFSEESVHFVLESLIYSEEEGRHLEQQYPFSGSFHGLNGHEILDWNKIPTDSSIRSNNIQLVQEHDIEASTTFFFERWEFKQVGNAWVNIKTGDVYTNFN